jgi:hypothetical protein
VVNAAAVASIGLFFLGVPCVGDGDSRIAEQQGLLRRHQAGETTSEEDLWLARLSEHVGQLDTALEVWDAIGMRYADQTVHNESSAPDVNHAEAARFFRARIRLKQKGAGRQPRPDAEALRKMADVRRNREVERLALDGRDGLITLDVETDLDGDGVDEIFMVGYTGAPWDERRRPFMCIAKWFAAEYHIMWHSDAGGRWWRLQPSMFDVVDYDGDGIKEIGLGFEPNTDNAAMLYFNGSSVLVGQL